MARVCCAQPGEQAQYDPARTLRMFGFGLFIYGPLQVGEQVTAKEQPTRTTGTAFSC